MPTSFTEQNRSWGCIADDAATSLRESPASVRPSRRTSFVQIGLTRHVWSQMTSLDKSSINQAVGRCRRRCSQASVISQSSPGAAQSAGAADQVLISLFLKHKLGTIFPGPSSYCSENKKDDPFKLGILMKPDIGLIIKWDKKKKNTVEQTHHSHVYYNLVSFSLLIVMFCHLSSSPNGRKRIYKTDT